MISGKKGRHKQKSGQCLWSFAAAKGPLVAAKVHAMTWHAHAAAWPRGENSQPQVRRCEATIHNMKNVVFCFVPLFRYSKDLSIGLMRILKVYERVHSCF